MYNLLIGGAAGQGIETTAAILEKLLKRVGYGVFTSRDFMSRVRGGHNFSLIRFGAQAVRGHSNVLDGIIALNEETIELHKDQLREDGFILCDSTVPVSDGRALPIAMDEMAKALGNPRVSGSIAIGVILKLFSIGPDSMEEVFRTFLAEKYVQINLRAVDEGYRSVDSRYPFLPGNFGDRMIISGSRAIALGALAAGVKFYCAYPMSPSTSIMEYLASRGDEAGVLVEQAEDEIAAINMAVGASYAGARAMTGTSGGGFSLMVEGLGLAGITETPLVAVNMQRPGPATGLPTRTEQGDLKFMISASQGEFPRLVIALRNHADAYYQTIRAFHLAEKYQIPVLLLCDQYLGDASATVEPFDAGPFEVARPAAEPGYPGEYLRYRDTQDGISPRLIPGKSQNLVAVDSDEHDERGRITESARVRTQMVDKRMRKLRGLTEELKEPEFYGPETCDTLLVGWGSMDGPLAEAVELLGREGKYAALVFGDIYPLPQKRLREKAAAARRIINVEQNATGQLAGLIREHTGIQCDAGILKYDGRQITGEEIAQRILGEAMK